MKLELSKSALTTDSTTVPVAINDPNLGIVEYRFRFPTKIEEITVDVSDTTDFAELHDSTHTIEVYYRNHNTPEETSGTIGNHGKAPIFDDTIDDDVINDGNDLTLYSSFTNIERLLSQSGWRTTLKLKNPLWCMSFGVRIRAVHIV